MTTVASTSPSATTTPAVLSSDDLLAKSLAQATGAVDAGSASGNGVLSAADLLQHSLNTVNGVKDNLTLSPTVTQISPVDKLLAAATPTVAAATTNYTDQDWYIKAKVTQLKQQISLYSTLPGLDPSGGVIDGLTKQVNDLVNKQQAKLKTANDAAAAAQKKVTDQQNATANAPPSATALLNKAKGVVTPPVLSDAVQTLLTNAAKSVDVTA